MSEFSAENGRAALQQIRRTRARLHRLDAKNAIAKLAEVKSQLGIGPPPMMVIEGWITDGLEHRARSMLARLWDKKIVVLCLDSPGGTARCARAIAKDIEEFAGFGTEVEIIAGQTVASGAVDLLSAAAWRTAGEFSRFLIHARALPPKMTERATAPALRRYAASLEKHDGDDLTRLTKRIGHPLPAFMLKDLKAGRDVDLDAQLARGIGLVDSVVDTRTVQVLFNQARRAERERFGY